MLNFWKKHSWMILLGGLAFVSCDTATPPSELSEVQGTWQLQAFELNSNPSSGDSPYSYLTEELGQ